MERSNTLRNEMKTFWARVLVVGALGASIASSGYSQTAPKDVLPPTNVAHPPVSPTLNVLTPDNVAVPSPVPAAIAPQAPPAPAQSIPQLPTPGVVETNKLAVPATGEPIGPNSKQSSLWTQTNATPPSAWGKIATVDGQLPSAAKSAPDPWSTPPPNARLWNSGTQLGSSGANTDSK